MDEQEVALIVGAGSGLSASLARTFSDQGMKIALAARNTEKLTDIAAETDAATDTDARAHMFTSHAHCTDSAHLTIVGFLCVGQSPHRTRITLVQVGAPLGIRFCSSSPCIVELEVSKQFCLLS